MTFKITLILVLLFCLVTFRNSGTYNDINKSVYAVVCLCIFRQYLELFFPLFKGRGVMVGTFISQLFY